MWGQPPRLSPRAKFGPLVPERRESWFAYEGPLASGNGPYDQKRFRPRRDRVRQRRVWRRMRQIFLAGEETQERPALPGNLIANGPAQHRIASLERVQQRAQRGRTFDIERHFARGVRQCSQMLRQDHPDHASVCTSTESTGGRSRTIGAHRSPASAEA